MGWGRTLLLGDIGNRLDIADCESEITAIKRDLHGKVDVDRSQDRELAELREDTDELKLYLAAVIRLLIRKGVLRREEISKFVELIDAEDGRVNGRMTRDLV